MAFVHRQLRKRVGVHLGNSSTYAVLKIAGYHRPQKRLFHGRWRMHQNANPLQTFNDILMGFGNGFIIYPLMDNSIAKITIFF